MLVGLFGYGWATLLLSYGRLIFPDKKSEVPDEKSEEPWTAFWYRTLILLATVGGLIFVFIQAKNNS